MYLFALLVAPLYLFLYWFKCYNQNNLQEQENLFKKMSLGNRMKYYETESEKKSKIRPYESYIVRLDGKNFSTKTSNLIKPFDDIFNEAMLLTSKDVLEEFHAATVFVQSDEISLVFKSICTKEEHKNEKNKSIHLFGGRVSKIISIIAGFTSTRFTINFYNLLNKSASEKHGEFLHSLYLERLNGECSEKILSHANFCFDARVTVIPLDKSFEVVNNLLWRSVHDGYRNFVSGWASYYITQNMLHKLNTQERKELLMSKQNINLDEKPCHYRYGWYIKSEQRNISTEAGLSTRHISVAKSFKIYYSNDIEKMIYSKYWNNDSTIEYEESRDL